MSEKDNKIDEKKSKKKQYIKPSIVSEDLMAFAASCNGSVSGGRKATTGAPNFCKSSRLNS